jgi:hypothetical protein
VPICRDKNGQSTCPVCKSTKKEATSYAPQFFKISIPKSKLAEPIQIEPIVNRASSKYEDTLSLSEHCVAGYENAPNKSSKLYNLPKSKTIDLKSSSNMKDSFSKLTIVSMRNFFILLKHYHNFNLFKYLF